MEKATKAQLQKELEEMWHMCLLQVEHIKEQNMVLSNLRDLYKETLKAKPAEIELDKALHKLLVTKDTKENFNPKAKEEAASFDHIWAYLSEGLSPKSLYTLEQVRVLCKDSYGFGGIIIPLKDIEELKSRRWKSIEERDS